jgi:hypothetical protein
MGSSLCSPATECKTHLGSLRLGDNRAVGLLSLCEWLAQEKKQNGGDKFFNGGGMLLFDQWNGADAFVSADSERVNTCR